MNVASIPKKRTRSVVRAEELEAKFQALVKVLPMMAQEGWLESQDICAMEGSCRAAKRDWCSDNDVWKPLVLQAWPHLAIAKDDHQRPVILAGHEIESYKSVFCDPRLWLAASAEQVKALPKWSETMHYDVECGRCGCNCLDSCPGIPITTEFRYEKKEQAGLFWPYDRLDVPDGEGYEHSGGTMIRVIRFCEPCFERLVELAIVKPEDYIKTRGNTLFDTVTKEMIEATTERKNDELRRNDKYPPFFSSGDDWSWQKMHKKVNADDVAIVVANALIQEGCQTRYLQLDGIHYNDPGFGPRGYKALAFALAINKTVQRIDFYKDWGDGCCCCGTGSFSFAEDKSNGLFLKALQHNKESALEKLPLLCPAAFGPHTWEAWKKVKPGLQCGPTLYLENYSDFEEYVRFDGEEEGDY